MHRHPLSLAGILLVLLILTESPVAHAQTGGPANSPANTLGRPRIGLVLSGGGALGAAHVGVLKVLEEQGVPIDMIAGTSMGAIVGGLYAAGYSANELDRLLEEIDWVDVFQDRPERELRPFRRKAEDLDSLIDLRIGLQDGEPAFPEGVLQGQKLFLILRSLTKRVRTIKNFDRLPIPFRAVAADLETGDARILGDGDLATAMRASMSVPGIFPPVEIDGEALIDGGVAMNLPIQVARDMGAEIVIVSVLRSDAKTRAELNSAVAILNQVVTILIQKNETEQLSRVDPARSVIITSRLGDLTSADFPRIAEMVPAGETGAREQEAALRDLGSLRTPADGPPVAARGRAIGAPLAIGTGGAIGSTPSLGLAGPGESTIIPSVTDIVLAFVDLENRSTFSDAVILAKIPFEAGELLDVAALEAAIAQLYATEDFEQIDWRLEDRDSGTGLVITAVGRTWARNYFRFGLELQTDFGGESEYNLSTTFTMSGLTDLGAEWRTGAQIGEDPGIFTEYYQPLDTERRFFVQPRLGFQRTTVIGPGTNDSLAEFRTNRAEAELQAGVDLDVGLRLSTGLRYGFGDAELDIGTAPQEEFDFRTGQAFVRAAYDTLDQVTFPTEGTLAVAEYAESSEALGASSGFRKLSAQAVTAASWGRNTVLLGGRAGTSIEDNLPVEERFRLGGFLNLSGLMPDQLSGRNLGFGRVIVYRRLTSAAPSLIDVPIFAGGSLEAGNVWETQDDITLGSLRYAGSLFVGADTFVGPLYLGYGRTDNGNNSFYLFLGQGF